MVSASYSIHILLPDGAEWRIFSAIEIVKYLLKNEMLECAYRQGDQMTNIDRVVLCSGRVVQIRIEYHSKFTTMKRQNEQNYFMVMPDAEHSVIHSNFCCCHASILLLPLSRRRMIYSSIFLSPLDIYTSSFCLEHFASTQRMCVTDPGTH